MAATGCTPTAAYWVAGTAAIVLSLCPKGGCGDLGHPAGRPGRCHGGALRLVGVLGVRIWLTNQVDFGKPVNQMTAAVA